MGRSGDRNRTRIRDSGAGRGQALALVALFLAVAAVLISVMSDATVRRRSLLIRRSWEEKVVQLARGATERYVLVLARDELEIAPPEIFSGTVDGIQYQVSSVEESGNVIVVTCRASANTPVGKVERFVEATVSARSFQILRWKER
ncbi:MAG TPA: hypothetical protein GX510_09785 [Firmicutes bacterium]|nr:hypothetical protein [Candidatus Fermentithermobacillaceae bacterium]